MHDFFRETVFGRILRYASRGRLFSVAEQRVVSMAEKYAAASSVSASRTFENGLADTSELQTANLEHVSNFQLVDWEDNDPEV
jgi:hypothetical protein